MSYELKVESTITRSETYWDVIVDGFWYSCDRNFKSTTSNFLQHQPKNICFTNFKRLSNYIIKKLHRLLYIYQQIDVHFTYSRVYSMDFN